MAKKDVPSTEAVAFSYQHGAGLMRILKNIEACKTKELKVVLKDMRLAQLLVCLAHHNSKQLHTVVEELLSKQLCKDSCYRRYIENENIGVGIATTTAIEFRKRPTTAQPKDEKI